MTRQDNRSLKTFKKDIEFSTKLERFWWDIFIREVKNNKDINIIALEDYGIDNSGIYVEKANCKADYKMIYEYCGKIRTNLMEIKWSPIRGKCTFKTSNLRSYVKQGAFILLFCNLSNKDLRRPEDHNFSRYIDLVKQNLHQIQYAVISPKKIEKMLTLPRRRLKYMGNKLCVTIWEKEYSRYFTLRNIRCLKQ